MVFSIKEALNLISDGFRFDGEDGDWYLVKRTEEIMVADSVVKELA